MPTSPTSKSIHPPVLSNILRFGLFLLSFTILILIVNKKILHLPTNDFTLYWSSSKLLLSSSNPYDPEGLFQYQSQEGNTDSDGVLMYYPPWTLLFILPLGLLDREIGQLAWILVSTTILFICTDKLWLRAGGLYRYRWLAWLVAFSFGPTFAALGFTGQITPLFLLGFTGFFLLIDKPDKDWLTGFFLVLTATKPQVPYLFFILLALWIIHRRRWRLLLSTILSVLIITALVMIFDNQVIYHFIQNLIGNTPIAWATPTLGTYIRYYLGIEGFWVQFIPPLITSILSILYWWRKRNHWDWQKALPWILFVSLITSPYTWTYDFVVLVIPLLIGLSLLLQRISRLPAILLAGFYIIINGAYWWLHLKYTDFYFLWFAPAMFIWFIMVQATSNTKKSNP